MKNFASEYLEKQAQIGAAFKGVGNFARSALSNVGSSIGKMTSRSYTPGQAFNAFKNPSWSKMGPVGYGLGIGASVIGAGALGNSGAKPQWMQMGQKFNRG